MSTKAQRLLSEATPLPWGYERSDPQPHSPFFEIAPFDSEGELDWSREVAATAHENKQDADLIVHAVNTLPLYEELREAAGTLAEAVAQVGLPWINEPCFCRSREAGSHELDCVASRHALSAVRAILRRLEEEER